MTPMQVRREIVRTKEAIKKCITALKAADESLANALLAIGFGEYRPPKEDQRE